MASDPLPPAVLEALQRGNTIDAIKLLRAATGLGLKEAKDVIDAHMRGNPLPPSTPAPPVGAALPTSVVSALQRGNKLEAIKLMREATGLGLKEAKDAVEAAQGGGHARQADLSPGQVPRSGSTWWIVAAVVALLIVAALVLLPSRAHAAVGFAEDLAQLPDADRRIAAFFRKHLLP